MAHSQISAIRLRFFRCFETGSTPQIGAPAKMDQLMVIRNIGPLLLVTKNFIGLIAETDDRDLFTKAKIPIAVDHGKRSASCLCG